MEDQWSAHDEADFQRLQARRERVREQWGVRWDNLTRTLPAHLHEDAYLLVDWLKRHAKDTAELLEDYLRANTPRD